MRFRYFSAAAVLAAVFFAVQSPASGADIPEITFEAGDYDIKGPDTLSAGLVSVKIVNTGKDLHHIQFLRLEDGKTVRDYSETAKATPKAISGNIAWVNFGGGPNAVVPGESAIAVINLEPGHYAVVCILPDPNGVSHVNLGMVKALTVEGAAASGVPEPKADLTITAHDFSFSPDAPFRAGKQTIRFQNEGTQIHEVLLVALPPGKTIGDFAAAFAPGASGPPPGKPIGGLTGIRKGRHEFFTADLAPGHYGLICFFEDPAKGTPHFALGMMYEFDVK